MKDIWIRQVREDDAEAVAALNTAAFGGPEEASIVEALAASGDGILSLVAHDDRQILGHIQFFQIAIDGEKGAAGLGPMSVHPDHQKKGIGGGLARFGLTLMEGAGLPLVFVLGHPDYYPRFGFSPDTAASFTAPWSGPAFMALRFGQGGPETGTLIYPPAFGT